MDSLDKFSVQHDQELGCILAYRLDSSGSCVLLSTYEHTSQFEFDDEGAFSDVKSPFLYNGCDKWCSKAIASVISKDPPCVASSLQKKIGDFKVAKNEDYQVVYGADMSGICLVAIIGFGYPSNVAIQMLQELYPNFMNAVGGEEEAQKATENSLSMKTKSVMAESCKKYHQHNGIDKTSLIMLATCFVLPVVVSLL